MANLLEVRDLRKVYEGPDGGVEALRGVTFSVGRGDFVAVRGPSGCGKSTLLHILGAMECPTEGDVRFDGLELGSLHSDGLARLRRRQIGFVFQEFNLFPTLTVLENVMLPLTLDGAAEQQARRRAARLLEEVGLADRSKHFPAQLSGGEMQRVAVARAVAAQPGLLLADEPTGNLDSENGRRVMQLLSGLNRSLQLTVLLATHSDEAASHAARWLLLRDGRLVAQGENPQSETSP
ncbi:MAG: ABC transporter ATP-binding protein [Planctomycetota bacterium]|nr:ABC transporter ATP-binding protein [Planctomycetota bacterium]